VKSKNLVRVLLGLLAEHRQVGRIRRTQLAPPLSSIPPARAREQLRLPKASRIRLAGFRTIFFQASHISGSAAGPASGPEA
jgi:hypothetical protein